MLRRAPAGVVLLFVVHLTGCSTPPAKNFSGHWIPVNHFRSAPTEIPLNPAYLYYASPMDETLKAMLTRWAKDTGRELSYRLPFDVTLYQPVADIQTADIAAAIDQLNTIYAAQGVSITATPHRIEIDPTAARSAKNAISSASTKTASPANKK